MAIAARIAAGDCDAESRLVERLRPGLQMILARRGSDPEQAADLCQETLIIVLKRLRAGTLEDPSRVAAFAGQTARQLLFDTRRRSELRRTDCNSEAVEAANIESTADASVEQQTLTTLVRSLLAELEHDRDREILRRFYLHEQDKSEVCRGLSLSPRSFDQVVFRARARLRALLNARGLRHIDFFCLPFPWMRRSWLS